jgi:hypothetical protein
MKRLNFSLFQEEEMKKYAVETSTAHGRMHERRFAGRVPE